ncbi:ANTAR domain-containing response regulator [Rhabdothermincola salaria]|uniref:ANTAR domain-containing response regulator n=1 Tax=Rhabdothermincola salaria TaxID=2903142 RepID=UPI001E53048A|nr:response regulator [Rhabdothermincola salaria]
MPTRVVIAEDEAIIRLDLKETLLEEGYEVVGETGRGDEAVELVKAHAPDIAILDIKMPGLDGLSAAREIAGERRAAVLILTAFSQRDLIEQARDAGALAYLVKPFQRSELIPAIELAIGRFQEMKALADQAQNLEDQLETRKIVDRAKGQLMDGHAMSEGDAFSFIQRTAMRERLTMKLVSERIIAGELVPPAS